MKALRVRQVAAAMSVCLVCNMVPVSVAAAEEPLAPQASSIPVIQEAPPPPAPTREIIVKFRRNSIDISGRTGLMKAALLGNDHSLITVDTAKEQNLALFAARDPHDVDSILNDLRTDPAVESAELNEKMKPQAFPSNDPLGSELWGLENTGQTVNGTTGTADADIDAPEAWAINEGTHGSVVIAVIDTGVKVNHEDLQANMWDGTNCKDENGNPLGGCLHGYDYAEGDTDPSPVSRDNVGFHGTHVAGTIAAVKGNGLGVAGVAPHAKIMAIRTDFSYFSLVKSIDFARQNGAKIINASFGGEFYSQTLFDAFKRFTDAGGLVVAAAGNNSSDNDVLPFYPSSFDLPNVISVAATDQNDDLAGFSNTGAQSVDVGAPGTNVKSTSIVDATGQEYLSETFDAVSTGSVPSGWVRTGTMGVRGVSDFFDTPALAGDTAVPYTGSSGGSVTLPSLDLTPGSGRKQLTFRAGCDTQYSSSTYFDFVRVEVSANGGPFTGLTQFDEFDLDDDFNPDNLAPVRSLSIPLASGMISPSTVFRFRWVTNGDADTGTTGQGCVIDDVHVIELHTQDSYEFLQGTSMATPHVAGLAGLIEGYTPNLTATDVRNIILTTGDERAALQGRTFTGRRINAAAAMRRADLIGPVITPIGNDLVTVIQGSPYVDAGATALDDIDGDVSARIVMTNPVDTSVLGDYVVRYNATDAAGNAAHERVRTVRVMVPAADTTPPVVTLLGGNPIMLTVGSPFVDPGATALDDVDGAMSSIVVTGTVDINTPGNYVLTYSATDAAGNTGTTQRTVTVTLTPDTTPPVLTLLGDNPLTIAQNAVFTDPGATALDDRDGDITAHIVVTGSVNTAVVGDYLLTYSVTDAAGNSSSAQRTVTVVVVPDTTPPVISLLGGSDVSVIAGDAFTDPGATALDDRDGTLTSHIVVTGSVNTNIPGVYTLHYNVSDAAGNAAVEKTRTVTVVPRATETTPSQPQRQESDGARPQQSSGGARGKDSRALLHAIALMVDLHHPEGGFDAANPTPQQVSFLCSVQRMIRGDMPQGLVGRLSQEVQRLTGIPDEAATTFLADGHACDRENLARHGGSSVVAATKPMPFPVASDGYPLSKNPTWNACVRGNVYNPEIIRQNPDRDPRTQRGYSCDHYSHAKYEWQQPDLGVTFTLVPGAGGRRPVLTLPRGFVPVSATGEELPSPAQNNMHQPPKPSGAGSAIPVTDADLRNAVEERRMQRTTITIDGAPVRSSRVTE